MEPETKPDWYDDALTLKAWANDVFTFADETMGMLPSEPLDELRGAKIPYKDAFGQTKYAQLFDTDGSLVYHDLSFYTVDMFKNQKPHEFRMYDGTRFTWMQTVILTAYNRALATFGMDAYEIAARWITVRSGHGIGKTGAEATIALHFLICLPGSQIGMTANSEQQVQDIFMKELGVWKAKLPEEIRSCIIQTVDHVRIEDSEDWFLRAQVARPEKPEALAGLHGKYVLIIVDEASGVADQVFEVMKGALTGDYYIVIYCSNPTRNEGEFFNSHKPGAQYTKLHFSSRHSPIVKPGYIEKMENDYPSNGNEKSDEVRIRVDGEFAGVNEMDDKGWIPLFANVPIMFEPNVGQIINRGVIALDPAGAGKDRSVAGIRDNVYLKEVLNEGTSNPKDLARKLESIRDAYNCTSDDIGIEAFGEGAKVVANVQTKVGETVHALLTDKAREETKDRYVNWKAELAWLFREWCLAGGIIITNNKAAWLKEMEKIKYKRDSQGRIQLMGKQEFKKLYGFSPDRFDMAIHTFFKAEAKMPVIQTKAQVQEEEAMEFLKKALGSTASEASMSSM